MVFASGSLSGCEPGPFVLIFVAATVWLMALRDLDFDPLLATTVRPPDHGPLG